MNTNATKTLKNIKWIHGGCDVQVVNSRFGWVGSVGKSGLCWQTKSWLLGWHCSLWPKYGLSKNWKPKKW